MSGIPVVVVPFGGVPVTPVDRNAPLLTVADNGKGMPITLAANSTPFIVEGYNPTPPGPMGPLDFVASELNAFTNFSRTYDLAADSAVLGFACYYEGDPVISIAHGGEPLTILHQERGVKILSLIAVGTGLTVESAELTITATGGSLHGGALRINEMVNVQPEISGWDGGVNAVAPRASTPAVTGAQGGITKIAAASTYNSSSRNLEISGATSVWGGYVSSGIPVDVDLSPSGPWVLGAGWSWVDGVLVHAGPSSEARIDFPYTGPSGHAGGGATNITVADGAICTASVFTSGTSRRGPYSGPIYYPVSGGISYLRFVATGDVTVSGISVMYQGTNLGWVFGSAPTVDGAVYGVSTTASGPEILISAVEVLGEDY